MHTSGTPGGVTNSTGDVDLDGQLVGRLAELLEQRDRRLAAAISAASPELASEQLTIVRRLLHLERVPS